MVAISATPVAKIAKRAFNNNLTAPLAGPGICRIIATGASCPSAVSGCLNRFRPERRNPSSQSRETGRRQLFETGKRGGIRLPENSR